MVFLFVFYVTYERSCERKLSFLKTQRSGNGSLKGSDPFSIPNKLEFYHLARHWILRNKTQIPN